MGEFANFEMDLTPTAFGSKVMVNGEDVSKFCKAVTVHVEYGQVTTVILAAIAQGQIKGEGVVEVVLPGQDVRAAILALSPTAVEERALERLSWGDGQGTMTSAIMATIVEMLGEAEPQANPENG